jgi:hypothetical protein
MMRVMWEEWRGGSVFSARQLGWFAVGTVLALFVLRFHPGAVFLVMGIGAVGGGFLSGCQVWNHEAAEWRAEGVPPWQYAVGKVAGLVLLGGAWALFLMPPLLVLALSWSMPWTAATAALAWVLAGSLTAQALAHAAVRAVSSAGRAVAALLAALWLGGGLIFEATRPWHPLWQIWRGFHDPERPFDTASWFLLMAMASILWILTVTPFSRRQHEPG